MWPFPNLIRLLLKRSLRKYLEFVVHAKKGKPEDANQRFRESSQLINKAISLVNSVWKQLAGK